MSEVKRKYDALIFDLFGTLIDNYTYADTAFQTCLCRMADALAIDAEHLHALWSDSSMIGIRMTGKAASFEEYLHLISTRLAIPFEAAQVVSAQQHKMEFTRQALQPRPGTISTLQCLQEKGYRVGLISDTTWEVPDIWETTPFFPLINAAIYSCKTGTTKPDPRMYLLACEHLAVEPGRCLYIGDGSSNELTGARRVGMDAILLCAPHERELVMQREDPRQWDGPVIEQVEEIFHFL